MTVISILHPMIAFFLLMCTQVASAQDAEAAEKTWQEAARKCKLSEDSLSLLEKNRILITNDAYKQVFSAYLSSKNPLFITSDSLLNVYHVLYEESILRLEKVMAHRLPDILRFILTNIDSTVDHLRGDQALVAAAKRRAVIVVAIALKLMDDSYCLKDNELEKILTEETRLIVKAEGARMPTWLGKPDASFVRLDYSRYKPRGFYVGTVMLERYFRAISWLQSIPFRVEKDDELLAMLMLGNCVNYTRLSEFRNGIEMEAFFRAYRLFIGSGDDWDLMTAARESQNDLRMDLSGDDLREKRVWLTKEAKGRDNNPQISDQIRFAYEGGTEMAAPNFRIISACRTPCAILFQRTTDPLRFKRSYPDGLEVSIALGSSMARKSFDGPQREDVLNVIDACKIYFQGSSLYFEYLNALRALVDKPETDAPDFMKNEAWGIKSCNTVMSGWAQLSHTWSLQAKQTINYLGMTMVPDGFVEPEPEFFSRMSVLAATTRKMLKEAGALDSDYGRVIQGLEKISSLFDGVKNKGELQKKVFSLPRDDMMSLEMPFTLMEMNAADLEKGSDEYFREQRNKINTIVADLKEGKTHKYPRMKEMLRDFQFDLEALWDEFEKTCRQLEVISHKQLRQASLNSSEAAFIRNYGRTIAGIMLYGGNSYLTPRDDAPRIVDVYVNPEKAGYLHVGIARPRKMYVLYRWNGKIVLCEGAVMPYYEFVTETRLTDESWREKLGSKSRPSIPRWLTAIVSGGDLIKPCFEDDR